MASAEAEPARPAGPGAPAGPAAAGGRTGPGPLAWRTAVLIVAAAASALGAWLGAWWVPFAVGVAVGLAPRALRSRAAVRFRAVRPGGAPPRGGVLAATVGAAAGWLLPVWVLALRGQPATATARAIAALAGLPPYAGVALAATALLAALQVLAGSWAGRAALPRGEAPPLGRAAS